MTNWSTLSYRERNDLISLNGGKKKYRVNNITIASNDDQIDLRPIHPAGTPVTGTTIGPDLSCQVGADGHKLCDWVWPDDAAYVAEAERFARRRQARGGRV